MFGALLLLRVVDAPSSQPRPVSSAPLRLAPSSARSRRRSPIALEGPVLVLVVTAGTVDVVQVVAAAGMVVFAGAIAAEVAAVAVVVLVVVAAVGAVAVDGAGWNGHLFVAVEETIASLQGWC
jgi:hypothetical protein